MNRAVIYSIPAFLGVIIEFVGLSITDKNLHALYPNKPFLEYIGNVGLVLSLLSPLFAIVAIVSAARSKRFRKWLLLLSATALLFALFGCGWTVSGHPTWFQGYD